MTKDELLADMKKGIPDKGVQDFMAMAFNNGYLKGREEALKEAATHLLKELKDEVINR